MYRENGPEDLKPVGEVEYVQGQAAASDSGIYGPARAAAAIVGHANLLRGEDVKPVLEALQGASPNRFRGIRHSVTWDPHPEVDNTAAHNQKGQLADAGFRAGAKVLARMGFTFEAWMFFPQLPELADFARAVPELPIVLNHVGGLIRVGPYANREDEIMTTWRSGIAEVAKCQNVYCKLGGLGMPRTGFDWHLRDMPIGSEELAAQSAPLLNYCIEQFGPQRCMLESNFPVDKVSFSYNVMWNAFKRFTAPYSASERAAMFHDVATRFYRIEN
jgi:predicted TIM-barrel fold metal-dependent hydrolase